MSADLTDMTDTTDTTGIGDELDLVVVVERVEVPTCEHVAQIVGKNGAKIKSLRNQTNTLIKTPLCGDEPVFTVTGFAANVRSARLAIEWAAHHFTAIMLSRSDAPQPGEVVLMVSVPHEFVGAVVGRNGTVINAIKRLTNTRINSPKRSTTPAFQVIGPKENALKAKSAIEQKVRLAVEVRSRYKYMTNSSCNEKLNTEISVDDYSNYSLFNSGLLFNNCLYSSSSDNSSDSQ